MLPCQLSVNNEHASRNSMDVENMWAKEQLSKGVAHIHKLEAEIHHLRRANRVMNSERDQVTEAYRGLIKQIAGCRRCMERLYTHKGCLPVAFTESRIRPTSKLLSLEDPPSPYHDSILPRGDSSSAISAADTTAQSTSLFGQDPKFLTISLPTDSGPLDNNGSSYVTDASSILTLGDTQPPAVYSPGNLLPARTSSHASSICSGLPEESMHERRAGSLRPSPGQMPSVGQSLRHEDPLIPSQLAHRDAEEDPGELSEGNLLAEMSSPRDIIDHESLFSSRASSDTSMQPAPESWRGNEIASEADVDEQASAKSSDSSSAETDEEDTEEDSDVVPATSADANDRASKNTDFIYAGRGGSMAPQGGDLLHSSFESNIEKPSGRNPPTLHHRKGPAGGRINNPPFSTEARPATRNAGAQKARSNTANEVFSALRNRNRTAPQNSRIAESLSSTTLGSSTEIRPIRAALAVSAPAMAGQRCDQRARHAEEETDEDLKIAIRESYTNFALSGQRLRFCYEPQTLDPTSINLNTNWKRRSKLNQSVVEKLLQMGSEICAFLPESDSEKATKKEVDLIQRLCKINRPQTACGSLGEVVGALRRERDVTKDELNLIDFEIYSTLIVMKCQSESEASQLFLHAKNVNKLSRNSLMKRLQHLAITNAPFLECTIVCIRFLRI